MIPLLIKNINSLKKVRITSNILHSNSIYFLLEVDNIQLNKKQLIFYHKKFWKFLFLVQYRNGLVSKKNKLIVTDRGK